MRIEPKDLLTIEDKQSFAAYIEAAFGYTDIDVDAVLRMWNKNKRTMFRALGKQLRYTINIDTEKPISKVRKDFAKVYPQRWVRRCTEWRVRYGTQKAEDFPFLFMNYLVTTGLVSDDEIAVVNELFSYENIRKGHIIYYPEWVEPNLKVLGYTIKTGSKTIRCIGRLVKLSHFDDTEAFEKWRNAMSDITTTSHIKAKLVISIHPIDFLSLSDNNSSWESCYQLLGHGMHQEATVTHMNSNCAVVAYLESTTPFEVGGFAVPNKTYRQLFYVHKDIICGGRSYPFDDKDLTNKIIDILQKMVYTNLKWKYQYSFQEYKDMMPIGDNSDVLCNRGYGKFKGHRIMLYIGSDAGYNDLVEHKDEKFYCIRNWVPHDVFICVTGPLTCVECGNRADIGYQNREMLCGRHHDAQYCHTCHKVAPHHDNIHYDLVDVFGSKACFCDRCIDRFQYCKELECVINMSRNGERETAYDAWEELGVDAMHLMPVSEYIKGNRRDWNAISDPLQII